MNLLLRPFRLVLRLLLALNAAEATVLSFICASLIGGFILFQTEKHRTVETFVPVLQQVQVLPIGDKTQASAKEETHVFTEKVTYQGETFIDSLFMAVSALCVTGLTSTDFSAWSTSGQIAILIMIQMGGLGIVMFTSIFALLIVRGLTERETFRDVLSGILDVDRPRVLHMMRHVVIYTFAIEGAGFLILGIHLQANPSMIGDINPWWWALFHSISAFNNAGFGLMNDNLMHFVKDPLVNYVIAALIILGGLGYPVLIAIHASIRRFLFRHDNVIQSALDRDVSGVVASSVQTRVVLTCTALLLFVGTAIPLFVEWGNPVLQDMNVFQKITATFFQSVSTRTAGFNTIDIGALHVTTLFLYMMLMYIGASPAGTGGGIKIPTIAVLYGYIKDWFGKPGEPVRLFGRKISRFAVSHAIRLYFFSTLFLGLVGLTICFVEGQYLITPDPTFNFLKVFFELFSAFGTVGLSMGFTGGVTSFSTILSPFSKVLIIITMLFGRLGPLTVLAALPWKRRYASHPLSEDYSDVEKIQIG